MKTSHGGLCFKQALLIKIPSGLCFKNGLFIKVPPGLCVKNALIIKVPSGLCFNPLKHNPDGNLMNRPFLAKKTIFGVIFVCFKYGFSAALIAALAVLKYNLRLTVVV